MKALKGLGTHLDLDHIEDFKKAYGNLLGILNTEVNITIVYTLMQFYNPPLRCFTFQDYQLALALEEYSHILGVGIKDQVPFVNTKELPKSHLLTEDLHLEKRGVKLNLKPKGGTHGFTLKFLVEKAIGFVDVRSWIDFNAIFALLIYGIVLFPSMEDFVDLASIHIFLSKNKVPTLFADTYYSIHMRTHKKKGIVVCCMPLLYRWFISHLPNKGSSVENKDNLKWSQRIMSHTDDDILWYSRAYDDVKIILNYGSFPNVPLIGTKGEINYNSGLALHQLGYPLLCKPDYKQVEEYEGVDNLELLKKIIRAWREICPQGRSQLGKKNCIAKEAYTQWVKDRI